MIRIDDPADPRIAQYTAIRERDLVGRSGRFIAEGEVVLRVLASCSRFPIESALIEDRHSDRLRTLVADMPSEIPVFVASREVMDRITGYPIHRGILAVGRRGPDPQPEALLPDLDRPALVLALVGIANHDNMGGIFRNAAAFGADAVLIDSTSCDPLYRKAIRVSVGGTLIVPFARPGLATQILDLLDEREITPIALAPGRGQPLSTVARPPRIALLVGAEGPGLPRTVLARARQVRIPMAPGFDSLNVATATGIALHHFAIGTLAR